MDRHEKVYLDTEFLYHLGCACGNCREVNFYLNRHGFIAKATDGSWYQVWARINDVAKIGRFSSGEHRICKISRSEGSPEPPAHVSDYLRGFGAGYFSDDGRRQALELLNPDVGRRRCHLHPLHQIEWKRRGPSPVAECYCGYNSCLALSELSSSYDRGRSGFSDHIHPRDSKEGIDSLSG